MLGRGSPGDLDGGFCWGCPIPVSFLTVISSSNISHFAKKTHSYEFCLLACALSCKGLLHALPCL